MICSLGSGLRWSKCLSSTQGGCSSLDLKTTLPPSSPAGILSPSTSTGRSAPTRCMMDTSGRVTRCCLAWRMSCKHPSQYWIVILDALVCYCSIFVFKVFHYWHEHEINFSLPYSCTWWFDKITCYVTCSQHHLYHNLPARTVSLWYSRNQQEVTAGSVEKDCAIFKNKASKNSAHIRDGSSGTLFS